MSDNEGNIETLCSLGLSRSQAKVYLTIVQLGAPSVGQVSRVSGIRREDVYRTLPKLEEMGLVWKGLELPVKLMAVSPEDAVKSLLKREQDISEKRISGLVAAKDKFLHEFKAQKKAPAQIQEPVASLLMSRERMLTTAKSMMMNAEKDILVVSPRNKLAQLIQAAGDSFKDAFKRGVQIRLISETEDYGGGLRRIVQDYTSADVSKILRYCTEIPGQFLITDSEAIVGIDVEESLPSNPGLRSNDENLVNVLISSFNELWKTGSELPLPMAERPESKEMVTMARNVEEATESSFIVTSSAPENSVNALAVFIREGLENNESVLYIGSDDNQIEVRRRVTQFGIDARKYEQTNALKILCSPSEDIWTTFCEQSRKKGFKGSRSVEEGTCLFNQGRVRELVELERTLQKELPISTASLLAYNVKMLSKLGTPKKAVLRRSLYIQLFDALTQSAPRRGKEGELLAFEIFELYKIRKFVCAEAQL